MSLNIQEKDPVTGELKRKIVAGSGGEGLPAPESKDKLLLSVENAETSELEWSQVDKSEVGDSPFKGTHDEWDALTDEQKAQYETVIFTDDYGEAGHATTKKYTKTTVANEIYYETAQSDGYFGVTANAQVSTALACLYILDDSNNRLCGFEVVCGTNNYGACNMYVKKGQKVEIKTVNTHGSYTFVPLF